MIIQKLNTFTQIFSCCFLKPRSILQLLLGPLSICMLGKTTEERLSDSWLHSMYQQHGVQFKWRVASKPHRHCIITWFVTPVLRGKKYLSLQLIKLSLCQYCLLITRFFYHFQHIITINNIYWKVVELETYKQDTSGKMKETTQWSRIRSSTVVLICVTETLIWRAHA